MSTLYVDNLQPNLGSQVQIPNLKPVAGSIIQTKYYDPQTAWSSRYSTSSSTFNITPHQVSITPTFSTSKIAFNFSGNAISNAGYLLIALYRNIGGTRTYLGDDVWGNTATDSAAGWVQQSFFYVDSPNTTSEITYEIWARNTTSSTSYIGWTGGATIHNSVYVAAQEIAQ